MPCFVVIETKNPDYLPEEKNRHGNHGSNPFFPCLFRVLELFRSQDVVDNDRFATQCATNALIGAELPFAHVGCTEAKTCESFQPFFFQIEYEDGTTLDFKGRCQQLAEMIEHDWQIGGLCHRLCDHLEDVYCNLILVCHRYSLLSAMFY